LNIPLGGTQYDNNSFKLVQREDINANLNNNSTVAT